MRPRRVMTAILSLLPRCTITSRKRGVASSWREPPLKRLMAMTTRIKFTITLAQSATNKKMLRQPSFLLAAMTGETCGERAGAQENSPRSPSILHPRFSILAASEPQWRVTCFLGNHEQHRSSRAKRENAPGGKNESAPWPPPESGSRKQRARAGRRRNADADEESPARGSPRLGAEAPHYRLAFRATKNLFREITAATKGAPRKLQTPSSKLQRSSKHQDPNRRFPFANGLVIGISLVLGAWSFRGVPRCASPASG